jgi:hypothetical protein
MQGTDRVIWGDTPVSAGVFEQGAPMAEACAACSIFVYSPRVPFPVTVKLIGHPVRILEADTVCGVGTDDAFA